jgi:hypothetical protein
MMFTKMLRDDDSTVEGRARHRERTKSVIKAARTRLMALDVVGFLDPFIWWSGRPVIGIRETQKHDPSLFDWPETAAASAAAQSIHLITRSADSVTISWSPPPCPSQ